MSEHHTPAPAATEYHVVEHHSPIKTPTQLIVVVVLSFVVPVIALIMVAGVIVGTPDTAHDNPALAEAAVAQRIQPVGQFVAADASGAGGARSGEDIVKGACIACHGAGVLGAPKIGDKAAWGKLIGQGLDKLTAIAIKGVKQMPARGGDTSLSDLEISRAIVYMANQSGGSLKEPAAPAAAAAAKK
ncbi:MAG: c-type cytochrome [Burkholderiales bacterium]